MCGAAIVAAARVYGDDPVRAVIGQTAQRRCLGPAVFGLAAATDLPLARLARVLGINGPKDLARARAVGGPRFASAERAARDAARAARAAPAEAPRAALPASSPASSPAAGAAPAPGQGANDQILRALKDGAHTAMGLASRLGLKEMVVSQALSALAHQGRVVGDAVTEAGLRARYWRLAPRVTA